MFWAFLSGAFFSAAICIFAGYLILRKTLTNEKAMIDGEAWVKLADWLIVHEVCISKLVAYTNSIKRQCELLHRYVTSNSEDEKFSCEAHYGILEKEQEEMREDLESCNENMFNDEKIFRNALFVALHKGGNQ